MALLAFKAFEKCCFFAADVSAGAVMDINVHVPAELVVLAEQAGVVALVDCCLQRLALADVFAANIDIGSVCAHGEAGDDAAFDQRVRIVTHDVTVLAGARL
ncbi:hypothetical protein D9M70_636740 [compost metagenome]